MLEVPSIRARACAGSSGVYTLAETGPSTHRTSASERATWTQPGIGILGRPAQAQSLHEPVVVVVREGNESRMPPNPRFAHPEQARCPPSRCSGQGTLFVGDAFQELVEGGDELLDALSFERGDDVVVVDTCGGQLGGQQPCLQHVRL